MHCVELCGALKVVVQARNKSDMRFLRVLSRYPCSNRLDMGILGAMDRGNISVDII